MSTARNKFERQLESIDNYQSQVEQLQGHSTALRNESDARVREMYPFTTQPDSTKYKVMKDKAYPMLEALIPGFSNIPYDVAIAAELSDTMVDAQEYRKLMGRVAPSNRPVPQSLSTPSAASPAPAPTRHNKASLINKMRSGEMDVVSVLSEMGMGWYPDK